MRLNWKVRFWLECYKNHLEQCNQLVLVALIKQIENSSNQSDFENTFQQLLLLNAPKGNPKVDALHLLGYFYEQGIGTTRNIAKAREIYEICHAHNHTHSTVRLSQCLVSSNNPLDRARRIDLLKGACAKKFPQAFYYMGLSLALGQDIVADTKKAVECYSEGAKVDNSLCKYALGQCLLKGEGIEKDLERAVSLIKDAVHQGHAEAQFLVSGWYERGFLEHIKVNAESEVTLLIASAHGQQPSAQYKLAEYYEQGNKVQKDLKKAVELFHLAAKQGHYHAGLKIGIYYFKSENIKDNYRLAVFYLYPLAKAGSPGALYYIGLCYLSGLYLSKDLEKAIESFQKALEGGHIDSFVQYALLREKLDQQIEKGAYEIVSLYKTAASKKNILAMIQLARWYARGFGLVEADPKKARLLALHCLEQESDKQHKEELLSHTNQGADRTLSLKAMIQQFQVILELFKKDPGEKEPKITPSSASEEPAAIGVNPQAAGDGAKPTKLLASMALDNLGFIYHYGLGVKQDLVMAVQYYRQAVELGRFSAHWDLLDCFQLGYGKCFKTEEIMTWYQERTKDQDCIAHLIVANLHEYGDLGYELNLDAAKKSLQDLQLITQEDNIVNHFGECITEKINALNAQVANADKMKAFLCLAPYRWGKELNKVSKILGEYYFEPPKQGWLGW